MGLPPESVAPELDAVASPSPAGVDWTRVRPRDIGRLYAECADGSADAPGSHYTPAPVAELLAEQTLAVACRAKQTPAAILDPACGCGSLLLAVLEQLSDHHGLPPSRACEALRGHDRDQGAVALTRLTLLMELRRRGLHDSELRAAAAHLVSSITPRDVLRRRPGAADCIVLNPPYVRAARGDAAERRRIRSSFSTAVGAFDLQVPFVQLALDATREGGVVGLLVSNKLLVADYGRALRRYMHERATLHSLLDLDERPESQPDAQVNQAILVATLRPARPQHRVRVSRVPALRPTRRLQCDVLTTRWPALHADARETKIVERMISADHPPLASLAKVRGGLRGFDYHACCAELFETGGMPVISPGNLRAYRAPTGQSLRLGGRQWSAPGLRARPAGISETLWRLFRRPKLVVKGIGPRPTAALVGQPAALLVAVWGVWAEQETLWALLALLNSLPVAWLHYQQLHSARIPEGSLRIPLSWLKQLPVPEPALRELAGLGRLRASAGEPSEQAELQQRIDLAVATGYGLGEAEMRLMAKAPLRGVQT